jgi:hypothetical protein
VTDGVHILLHFNIILLFIASTCFNANMSYSGTAYWLPAKLQKRFHAVLGVYFKELPQDDTLALKHVGAINTGLFISP